MRKVSVLLILLLVPVLASSLVIDIDVSPPEQTIRMNETAQYSLFIRHDSPDDVQMSLYSLDVLWDIRTKDALIVPPQGLNTTLFLRPLRDRDVGFYGIPITFNAREFGVHEEVTVLVGLRPSVDREYTPSIKTIVSVPEQVDPRQGFSIIADVNNLNRRNIPSMTVYIRSGLVNEEHQITIGPLERKQFVFNVTLDPKTLAQEDQLHVTFVTEHESRTLRFESKPVALNIIEYGGIEEEVEQTRGFLRVREESHLTNTGNAQKTITYRVETGFLQRLFTSTAPKVGATDGFYEWQVTLGPGESRTLIVERNYWPALVFFIAVVLLVTGYYLFRAPLIVRKEVRKVNAHELRVSVFVKNRSARALPNVSLVERVPKIFSVGDKFGPGKVMPAHVAKLMSQRTNDHKGTRMRWDLGLVSSGDELVVQYTLHTRIAMVGTVTLEPVTAHYQRGERQAEVKSASATAKLGQL